MTNSLALAGGIFFLFVFVHFIMDWIFQSHWMATLKHSNLIVRVEHCSLYALGFLPIMILFQFSLMEIYFAIAILFFSHLHIDSYDPVYLWAKYIRKPPQMDLANNSYVAFLDFVKTPLGLILCIVVDQLLHFVFLLPLVWMALN